MSGCPIPGLVAVSVSIASAFTYQHLVSRNLQIFRWPMSLSRTKFVFFSEVTFLFVSLSLCLSYSPSAIFLSSCFSFPSCSVRSSSSFSYMLHCPICFRCAHGSASTMLYIRPNLTPKNTALWQQSVFMCSISHDRLCGPVLKVPGYRSRGPGLDSRRY
jgi:hypothetical protein